MNDAATILELLRTELLRTGKDSMFYVANSDQELLLVKKKIGDKQVWALPEEADFKDFEQKLADYIKKEYVKNGKK